MLDNVELLARLEVHDVGKPLKQARADAIALARYCEFYGGAADKVHGETLPFAHGYTALTLREPHGVTGHIVPWNYPMQIVGRSVGAALAMGNACVLKPAEEACLTVLAFARICAEAGLPAGALNVVTGLGEEAGAALAAHPDVDHVSFTGSVATGALVQIAAARNAVPVTLELGGKSPQIVFADADLDAALPFLVNAGIQNAGQTCSAASRILVERPVFERGEASHGRALSRAARRRRRWPTSTSARSSRGARRTASTTSSPSRATAAWRLRPKGRSSPTRRRAATTCGRRWSTTCRPSTALAQDEIFGPVQVLIAFDGEDDAIRIANGTKYGLIAGVWTRDGGRQLRVARALKCGQVFVNNYGAGGGIELPFGGVKHSGHGREKGFEALYGFSTLKTIAIQHG